MKLNKKKIVLVFVIILLIVLVVVFFGFLNTEKQNEIDEKNQNLFPFGEIAPGNKNKNTKSQESANEIDLGTQETEDLSELDYKTPRLRKISDFPTGGFIPITRKHQEERVETETDEEGNTTQTSLVVNVEKHYVRYSAIENANVYETQVELENLDEVLLAQNFIPNAEYAFFNQSDRAFFQYWNKENHTPETYLAQIEKIKLNIKPCPFKFSPIKLDEDDLRIVDIHLFLNRNPKTRVAESGINSPGNESSLVIEDTLTSIKNFQTLYELDIDGNIGLKTKEKMKEVCDKQQREQAEKELSEKEYQYTISGFFLPQGITSISINPSGDKAFYLKEDAIGVIGILRDLIKDSEETIFESPFTEWVSDWNYDNSIELTTKPSYRAKGYNYHLNPKTGRYFKSIKERNGITILASPDGKKLLVVESLDNTVRVSIHNKDTNRTRPLVIQTFVEKCVWSDDSQNLYCAVPNSLAYGNEYPDIWYQGLESYTDSLWEINSQTFEENVLSNIIVDYNQNIDVEHIAVDKNSDYLYFIDKKTEHLWSYRLYGF